MDRFHWRWCRLRRRLHDHFNPHHLTGDLLAQMRDQSVEELKGLALIFIKRITLCITAPSDDLPQMIKRHEMFAPEMIKRLQEHLFFDIGHNVGRILLDAALI